MNPNVKARVIERLQALWEQDRGKVVFGGGAFLLSVCILLFGFFPMLFIALMTAGGLWLGHRLDLGEYDLPFDFTREHEISEWERREDGPR